MTKLIEYTIKKRKKATTKKIEVLKKHLIEVAYNKVYKRLDENIQSGIKYKAKNPSNLNLLVDYITPLHRIFEQSAKGATRMDRDEFIKHLKKYVETKYPFPISVNSGGISF